MRIAISGSHLVGKTTLAEALADALAGYELVPEPYYLLEDDGHEFAEMPSMDDFELQLTRSLQGDIIVYDAYGLKIDVITVTGTPQARLHQVVAHLRKTSD